MNCRQASYLLPGYLDGAVKSRDTIEIRAHLEVCGDCRDILDHYRRMSVAFANVAAVAPPPELAAQIRARAVEARRAIQRRQSSRGRLRLVFHNIFQPLAIPATGGILAAMFAFLFVVQGILAGAQFGAVTNDLPISILQPARLESLAQFPAPGITTDADDSGLLIVEAVVNEQGQVANYKILEGPRDAASRRQLDQILMFSRFRPTLAFGRPMSGGRVILNFSEVRVKG
jgi:Putative zinc-finger